MPVAAALFLVACGAPPRHTPSDPGPRGPAVPPPDQPTYRVDPDASELRLEVYRDGPMARLGHDHVIQNRTLSGWGALGAAGVAARFYLEVPVGDFVIDDPAARAEAGPGFEDEVSADAKAGTRANMLGARLLNAAQYPLIRITGRVLPGDGPAAAIGSAEIRIAGAEAALDVPLRLLVGADTVSASADFPLQQSALGLAPFSVMMGALRVRDDIQVRLRIVARRVTASGEAARQ